MKVKFTCAIPFLLLLILSPPADVFAQLFGSSGDDLKKINLELRKLNTRLENLKKAQSDHLQRQQQDLSRQIEEIKQILPPLQGEIEQLPGTIEQNKQETLIGIGGINSKLTNLEEEVKSQLSDIIHQQNKNFASLRQEQASLKEGLAQDMEKFEQSGKSNFQDFSAANQKTMGGVVRQLEAQSASMKKSFDDTIALFRTDVIPTIARENEKNRKIILEHVTKINADLKNSVLGKLKDSAQKENVRNVKADLANEKLSRLIEILKTIAKQQAKLSSLATTLGDVQKAQVGLMNDQKEIKEALADLRRKANVNISRNDDIKKALRQLSSPKSGTGGK